jgi:PAS domain S-box-containing protein
VVSVTYERASVLEPWFRHLYVFLPLAILLVAGILLATSLVRRQTRSLSQKGNMLEAALANISQGVCMFDASARITLVSQRYLQMYNLSSEVVKPGCTLRELLDHRSELGLLAADAAQHCDEILREVAQKKTISRRIVDHDGRIVRAINHPIRGGGWVTTHEDATEQVRAEIELEDTRNFLKTVIDHVPTTIFVKSTSDLRYVLLNAAGQKFFGLRPDQIIGKAPHECFPKDLADFIVARDKMLIETGRSRIEDQHSVQTADGVRQVTTETLVVRGGDGVPKYLMNVMLDVTERKRSEAQIVYIAHHDLLTGLPNRTFFMEKIEDAGARLRRWGEPFTVLLLDLDRFKIVNDSLGHPAGDARLKETALRLKASLRETDVLARLGGDEFAIIQAGEAAPREGAAALA